LADLSQQSLFEQISDVRQRATWVVERRTPEKLTQRPDPSRWSIAECIGHLNIVIEDYQPLITAAIEHARKENLIGKGPFNLGMLGRFMVKTMEPPVKRKFKAVPRLASPVPVGDASKLLEGILARQDELERLIRQAEGLNQEKIKIQSPYAWWLRLRLCAVFAFILAHERRHIDQAEAVCRQVAPG
jgi:hypothetical protein